MLAIMSGYRRDVQVLHPGLSLRIPLMKGTVIPLACWHPNWKSKVIAALLRRTTGGFVDVGANIGQTLCDYIYAGTACGYWGIEPNPECVHILHEVVRLNKIPGCTILNCALWDTDGTGDLFLEQGVQRDTRATLRPSIRPGRHYETVHVPLCSFEAVRTRHEIPETGLIKIDVEGAELNVLRGMTDTLVTDRPPVLCEVLLRDKHADTPEYFGWTRELTQFLAEINYQAYQIDKNKFRPALRNSPTSAFPLHAWTPLRAGRCDYLFLPAEKATQIRRTLDKS